MKYRHKKKRIIAIILIMVTCIVNAFSYTVYAKEIDDKAIYNDLEDINDESIVLTSLLPNTAQDWAIAYKDGIGYPGFFHNEVEKNIKNNNIGFEYESLQIPGAGRYGFNGRADIVKMTDNVIYIWDVKPALNGYFPNEERGY